MKLLRKLTCAALLLIACSALIWKTRQAPAPGVDAALAGAVEAVESCGHDSMTPGNLPPAQQTAGTQAWQSGTPAGRESGISNSAGAPFPSLNEAFEAAQHAIHPVSPPEQSTVGNGGVQYFAHNPDQAMTARFLAGSVRMQSALPESKWWVELRRPGLPPAIKTEGRRVEYTHTDGVREWYENGSSGFQHGFIVPAKANGEDDGMLRMRIATNGLSVADDPSFSGDLLFQDSSGRALAAYRGLKAWDSAGQELDAEMRSTHEGFEIAVNDRNAVYPVHIDPYFINLEQSHMTEMAGTGGGGDRFGYAMALDGDTAVVTSMSAPSSLGGAGRAYVFTRSAGVWSLQGEVWAGDGPLGAEFGNAVALEGDTLVVGSWKADISAPNNDDGAAYVFQRSQGQWNQIAKLAPQNSVSQGFFGISLALQGDELAVGSNNNGVHLYRRVAGGWEFNKKVAANALAHGFGTSVAISGGTMIIGAPREAASLSLVGAAYVFGKSAGEWVQQQRIASPFSRTEDMFGMAVALDGDIAAVGAPYADTATTTDSGGFAIYRRNGSGTWVLDYTYQPGGSSLYRGGTLAVAGNSVLVGGALVSSGSTIYQPVNGVWQSRYYFNYRPGVIDGTTLLLGASTNQGDGVSSSATFGAAFIYEFDGTAWPLRQRLTMGDSKAGTGLGNAMAIQGDTALIAASSEPSPNDAISGAVYVFARSNGAWQQQARLTPASPGSGLFFGSRIALDGDTAAVSCVGDSHVGSSGTVTSNVGSVTVFVRSGTTWSLQRKIYASDYASSDNFGSGLALEGNNLLIGSPFYSKPGTTVYLWYLGKVYWFSRSGTVWTERTKFQSPITRDHQRFGCSIGIDGNTAVIGAETLESGTTLGGRAFIYTFNGTAWVHQASLQAPSPSVYAYFGRSVAISGDTVLIGAPGADLPGVLELAGQQGVGQAYVYTRSGSAWSHQATLNPLDGTQATAFGSNLRLEGNTAVIRAGNSVELFSRSGSAWTRQNVRRSTINPSNGSFGAGIALDGDILAVGAPSMGKTLSDIQRTYTNLGSVEFFRIASSPIIQVRDSTGASLTDGGSAFNFGARLQSSQTVKTITLTNLSGDSISGLNPSLSGAHSSAFEISGWVTEPLAPDSSRTFHVVYRPDTPGIHTAQLGISGSIAMDGSFDVQLAGECLTPRGAFDQWAAGLPDPSPEAMPHHDGVSNLLKYAFNLNPNGQDTRTLGPGSENAGLPSVTADPEGPSPGFLFQYLRRKGSGLLYLPLCSTDLASTSFTPLPEPAQIESLNDEWERVTHRVPVAPGGSCFFKMAVTVP